MESLLHDIRYGVRLLAKNRQLTFAAIVALVLGIGVNTAIFSVVNGVLLRPLPYKNPEQLHTMVWEKRVQGSLRQVTTSYPNFADWTEQSSVFERLAAFSGNEFNLTGGGNPERLIGQDVTANLFDTLNVAPFLGRGFTAAEQQPGRNQVVILSYDLWQRRFAKDRSVIGNSVSLNNESYAVIGVMPEGFQFPPGLIAKSELWTPLVPGDDRGQDSLEIVGRLKRGATRVQAEVEMNNIATILAQMHPQTNNYQPMKVISLHEYLTGDAESSLLILLGAVALVLLIACANVASLLFARATARQREIAVRMALGAGRRRLIRQMLTESVVLALIGGLVGLAVAFFGIPWLVSLVPAGTIPRLDEITIDARVLAFTFGLSVLTGVIFGVAPALQASKPDFNDLLKEGGRSGSAGSRTQSLRGALLIFEVALSLLLLIGAGLLTRSFLRLRSLDPGFEVRDRLTLRVDLLPSKYREPVTRIGFYKQLTEQLGSLPGVRSVGAINNLPFTEGNAKESFNIDGRPNPGPDDLRSAEYRVISPDYFKTMGVSVLDGRAFDEGDTREGRSVAIINEAMANRLWPGESPVGKRLYLTFEKKAPRDIVGVVRDSKHTDLKLEAKPQMYVPYPQRPLAGMNLVLYTSVDPLALASAVRSKVYSLDAEQPVYNVKTMDQWLVQSIGTNRFNMFLISIFGSASLLLSLIGIYGVISYSVSQRTGEIGIRMALGAGRRDVLSMIIVNGMKSVAIGIVAGVAAALLATKVLSALLYSVTPSDPVTFVIASFAFVTAAVAASLLPAWRATKINPITALRHE